MKYSIAIIVFLCAFTFELFSQSIGIGASEFTPHASSALEIRSNEKGLLIPRMSNEQRNAIVNPAEGLLIYQTDGEKGFYYHSDGNWLNFSSGVNISFDGDVLTIGQASVDFSEFRDTLEYQKLYLDGDTLHLTHGDSVVLPKKPNQELYLNGNNLGITGSINTVDLSTVVTQNQAQLLSLRNDTLRLSNGGSVNLGIYKNQVLSLNQDILRLTNGGEVDLSQFAEDMDDQQLHFQNDTLYLTNSNPVAIRPSIDLQIVDNILKVADSSEVDLSVYLDNRNQQISILGDTVFLTNGGRIDLSKYKNQQLTLQNNTLGLSGGGVVDLEQYLDDRDEQKLSIDGDTIKLTNGGKIPFSALPKQRLSFNDNILGITEGNSFDLSQYINTDNQQLSRSNDTIRITGGNFIKLPKDNINDADADPTNEIQNIHISNDTLYLDKTDSYVILPHYVDSTSNQIVDNDKNPTNELQSLSIRGDTIFLSRGGFAKLPDGTLDTDEQELYLSGNQLSIENANSVDLSSINTDDQRFTSASLSGTILELSIENGNSISINLATLQDGTGTDNQILSIVSDSLAISRGNKLALKNIDNQVLSIREDTIFLTNGGFVKLPEQIQNTDNQNLERASLTGTILRIDIENGESVFVDLQNLQDGTGTDNQALYVAGGNLHISGANYVPLNQINTDNQTLRVINDTIVLSKSESRIPLTAIAQQLFRDGDTLYLSRGGKVVLPSIEDYADDQSLLYDPINKTLAIENGNSVNLSGLSNSQRLIANGDLLGLTGNSPLEFIHKDNFDKQRLTLSGDTLKLSNGGEVILPSSSTGSDNQTLSVSATALTIEDGNSILLSSIDKQQLSISGTRITISNGNSIDLPAVVAPADDQQLTFNTTTKELSIESGNSVNLSSINTDNQAIDAYIRNNNELLINISNGNEKIVNLDPVINAARVPAQVLSTSSDSLRISSGNSIPINAIDKQILYLSNDADSIYISNGGGIPLPPDAVLPSHLILSRNGDNLSIAGGNSISLAAIDNQELVVDPVNQTLNLIGGFNQSTIALGSINTDEQELHFNPTTKVLTIDNGVNNINLASINTDNQQLRISRDTIYLDRSTPIKLPTVEQNNQTLSLNGRILSISSGNQVDFSQAIRDTQNIISAFDASNNNLTIGIENGTSRTHNLSSINTDNQTLITPTLNGSTLNLGIARGNNVSVNLASLTSGVADNQNIESFILNGTDLFVDIERGDGLTVDLSPLFDDIQLINPYVLGGKLYFGILNGDTVSIALSAIGDGTGTDDQILQNFTINGTNLSLSIEGGNTATIPVATLKSAINTDNQTISNFAVSGTNLNLALTGGNSVNLPLANIQDGTGTDDQTLQNFTINGTNLSLSIEGGNTATIPVATLKSAINTDNQTISNFAVSGTNLNLALSGGNSVNLPLATIQDGTGTDDQQIDQFDISNNYLVLKIEDGGADSIPLASIADGTGTDDQTLQNFIINGTNLSLSIEGGNTATIPVATLKSAINTDNQTISNFAVSGTNLNLALTGGNSVNLPLANIQDGTGTDDQQINQFGISNNYLVLKIEDGGADSIPLSDVQWNHTANQNITLAPGFYLSPNGTDKGLLLDNLGGISVSGGMNVAGSSYFSGGVFVNDSYYLPTTDGTSGQLLTTDGSGNLSWTNASGGSTQWNHTATQNIALGSFSISNDGDSEGITVESSGRVNMSTGLTVNGGTTFTDGVTLGASDGTGSILGFLPHYLRNNMEIGIEGTNRSLTVYGTASVSSDFSANGNISLGNPSITTDLYTNNARAYFKDSVDFSKIVTVGTDINNSEIRVKGLTKTSTLIVEQGIVSYGSMQLGTSASPVNFNLYGAALLDGNVAITGDVELAGDLLLGGGLTTDLLLATNILSDNIETTILTVSDQATLNSTIASNLQVTTDAEVQGDLSVDGTIYNIGGFITQNNATVLGDATINGHVTIAQSLTAAGNVQLGAGSSNTILTRGTLTIADLLIVNASSTFNNNVEIGGAAGANLTVNGLITTDSIVSNGASYAQKFSVKDEYTLPLTDGGNNEVMVTNGNGAISWTPITRRDPANLVSPGETKIVAEANNEYLIRQSASTTDGPQNFEILVPNAGSSSPMDKIVVNIPGLRPTDTVTLNLEDTGARIYIKDISTQELVTFSGPSNPSCVQISGQQTITLISDSSFWYVTGIGVN